MATDATLGSRSQHEKRHHDTPRGGTRTGRTAVHLDQARSLIAADPPAAVTLLRKCLASRNPYTAPVNAEIRDMAELYVRLTIDTPAETTTVGWAVYLRRAVLSRYGETDERTHDTARLLTELAQRRATTPTSPIDLPTLTTSGIDGGSRASKAVTARFSVVDLLHTSGLCEAAEREAIAALCQWAPHHDAAPDITYTYLVDTIAALDHCGRIKQGESVLNAYGAMLPEAGTAGDTYLRSYVTLRLGNRQQIQRHQNVCGIRHRLHRPHPRRSYEDLHATILHSLAHDEDDSESHSTPTPTARTPPDQSACSGSAQHRRRADADPGR